MKSKHYIFGTMLILAIISCGNNNGGISNGDFEWLIPESEILDGGPGKNGIPSIDEPNFTQATEVNFLSDAALVVAINYGDEARAYPHQILDWHEIVNDKIQDVSLALTYCPLTGTGIGWDRNLDGKETTFGVSGLLFNTNLIPYDRASGSNWSQMKHECVHGPLAGTKINILHVVEMSFGSFKKMYPNGRVMNEDTGFNRTYGDYPYGDYRTNEQVIFPISNEDNRLPKKKRVLGLVLEGKVKAYTFDHFPGNAITMKQDQVGNRPVLIVGSETQNFLTAYYIDKGEETLEMTLVTNNLPIIMKDQFGNSYDLFGNVVAGPELGTRLEAPLNYIGYWFSWASFNEEVEVFE